MWSFCELMLFITLHMSRDNFNNLSGGLLNDAIYLILQNWAK